MSSETVKVFRVNDYEWWAGHNLNEIRTAYKEYTGIDPDHPDDGFENPHELSDEAMNKMRYCYNENDYWNEAETRSFREQLDLEIAEGRGFPSYFAGTEW